MDKYHFIISSRAGKGSNEKLIEKLEKNLPLGIKYEMYVTEHENHVRDICREVKTENIGKVIVCGGDGTVNEAANELAGSDVPMGVIPTGTGNDFSRSIYGDIKLTEIISRIDRLVPSPIDLIYVEITGTDTYKGYAVNVISLGLDSLILKTALEIKDRNPWMKGNSYFLAIIKCLPKIELLDLKIVYKDINAKSHEISEKMILGSICNGRYYGNGFNPNPNGILDDGINEICFLKDTPLFEILPLILKYRKGNHLGSERLLLENTIEGEVSMEDGEFLSNVDGIVYSCNKIKWRVSKNKLNLLQLRKII